MNELEKLREELEQRLGKMSDDLLQFESDMSVHMHEFQNAITRAREIERQAGIGEEK